MSAFQSIQSAGHLVGFNAVIPFAIAGMNSTNLSLAITTTDKGLAGIDYVHSHASQNASDKFGEEVIRQLERYFDDCQWRFDLALDLSGTVFQQRLWRALSNVPAGNTDTYGQLAHQLSSGAQAVGQACRRNPVPVVVPCHRIVSLQGMGGYAGEVDGEKMSIKRALLAHEGYSGV